MSSNTAATIQGDNSTDLKRYNNHPVHHADEDKAIIADDLNQDTFIHYNTNDVHQDTTLTQDPFIQKLSIPALSPAKLPNIMSSVFSIALYI